MMHLDIDIRAELAEIKHAQKLKRQWAMEDLRAELAAIKLAQELRAQERKEDEFEEAVYGLYCLRQRQSSPTYGQLFPGLLLEEVRFSHEANREVDFSDEPTVDLKMRL